MEIYTSKKNKYVHLHKSVWGILSPRQKKYHKLQFVSQHLFIKVPEQLKKKTTLKIARSLWKRSSLPTYAWTLLLTVASYSQDQLTLELAASSKAGMMSALSQTQFLACTKQRGRQAHGWWSV